MGILKNIIGKIKNKKERYEEAEIDEKVARKLEERKKNANERELERYQEENRQKAIAKQLEVFRKRKQHEMFHTNHFTHNKNIFNGKSVFKNEKNIMCGGKLW